jgi:hypothetical protein
MLQQAWQILTRPRSSIRRRIHETFPFLRPQHVDLATTAASDFIVCLLRALRFNRCECS